MIDLLIAFYIGAVVGASASFFGVALCVASSMADKKAEELRGEKHGNHQESYEE